MTDTFRFGSTEEVELPRFHGRLVSVVDGV